MADARFHKSEVVVTLPWIELSHRNLVSIDLDIVSEYHYENRRWK